MTSIVWSLVFFHMVSATEVKSQVLDVSSDMVACMEKRELLLHPFMKTNTPGVQAICIPSKVTES